MEHHRTRLTRNQFGLIGKTLSHSFSRDYHNRRFQREGIAAHYSNFELDQISDIKDLIAGLPTLKGLNVTVPFKESVLPFLDDVSTQAMAIGAVNTIVVEADRLIGYNTDVFGFEESLRNWIDGDLNGALVLGTGGASRAVGQALSNLGIAYVSVSRTGDENR
ncbi:MAG: shikimate dehydrogenase, partial [Bacteroidetes bacterium]